uniref:Uncharacterized protein n=1 Tax=Lepeophtheirus salmonis TaxID=72036 RepID=A0A0K2VEU2_LEPSM
MYNTIKYGGLSVILFVKFWKYLNSYWIKKLWDIQHFRRVQLNHFLVTKELKYTDCPYSTLFKVFEKLEGFSTRFKGFCDGSWEVIKKLEVSLGWEKLLKLH